MAQYKVQSDGTAPAGLKVDDLVVTGGGTYRITYVNSDGSYQSELHNRSKTTVNTDYREYANPPQQNYNMMLSSILSSINGISQDKAVSNNGFKRDLSALTWNDALKIAEQSLIPKYKNVSQQTAIDAAQNLDKSGLYDTFYGQALSAAAQRDVSNDMNTAIYDLAMQMKHSSDNNYLDLLKQEANQESDKNSLQISKTDMLLAALLKLMQMNN